MGEDRDDLMNGAPRSDASTVSRLRPRLPGCPYRLAAYICLWYTVSVGLTLYNKWLFYHHGFSFPLTATAFHFAIKVPLAWIVLRLRNLRWRVDSRTLWRYVAPVGLATAADIACSNTAFLYITVTYYTVAKSSVPLWILLFSVCLRLRRMRRELALVLVLIAAGICLASFDLEEDVEPVLAVNCPLAQSTQTVVELESSSNWPAPHAVHVVPLGSARVSVTDPAAQAMQLLSEAAA